MAVRRWLGGARRIGHGIGLGGHVGSLLAAWIVFGAAPLAGQASDVADVEWMAGCWRASAAGMVTDEVWMAPEGGLMVGMVRTVRGGRSAGYELLRLSVVDGVLVLSAHPSGQEPADFRASSTAPQRVRFENAAHDFPRVIEYDLVSPDSLVASVYGDVTSDTPAFRVLYGRNECPGP